MTLRKRKYGIRVIEICLFIVTTLVASHALGALRSAEAMPTWLMAIAMLLVSVAVTAWFLDMKDRIENGVLQEMADRAETPKRCPGLDYVNAEVQIKAEHLAEMAKLGDAVKVAEAQMKEASAWRKGAEKALWDRARELYPDLPKDAFYNAAEKVFVIPRKGGR